jgi:hypothetical protein
VACLALVASLCAANRAWAIKPFTLVEDGYPERVGQLESENTFNAAWRTPADHSFQNYAMENELEYGLVENFTLRGKVSYFYQSSDEFTGFHFDTGAVAGQVFFSNPNTDAIGISVIASFGIGEHLLTAEQFLVVQKDTDHWILGYNFGLSTEIDGVFEGGQTSVSGSIINSAGAMYCLTRTFRVGAEASAESAYDNWNSYTATTVFVGPVLNWIPNNRTWLTAGFDVQATNTSDEPKHLFTLIFGYYF